MFAYCLNNPVNWVDPKGQNSDILANPNSLVFEDSHGAGLLFVVIVVTGSYMVFQQTKAQNNQPLKALIQIEKQIYEARRYSDDDVPTVSRVGQQKGKAPRNNKNQNEQFRAIIKKLALTLDEARRLHDEITGEGYSYDELLQIARDLFGR